MMAHSDICFAQRRPRWLAWCRRNLPQSLTNQHLPAAAAVQSKRPCQTVSKRRRVLP